MVRNCVNCKSEMIEVFNTAGGAPLLLQEKKKGFGAKCSAVKTFVCPNCGHVEFVAEKPELFK